MIICDLDYLESISEVSAIHLNGGSAITIIEFLAYAYGDSTNTSTIVINQANNGLASFALSSVHVSAIASGDDTLVSASASATSSASSQDSSI